MTTKDGRTHALPTPVSPLPPPPEVLQQLRTLALGEDQVAALQRFLELLEARNQHMNLTSVRGGDMWQRHVLDSLSLLPWYPARGRAVDLGSGGGLPGLPLAIARPDMAPVWVESVGKKAAFLRETVESLGLAHVRVESSRIEDVGRGALREQAQVVTARALARLPVLLELAIPLLEVGGRLLAIKGEQAATEVAEARRALAELKAEVETLERTPTGTVVVVRKRAPTPGRYPRRAGEPKRSPLR